MEEEPVCKIKTKITTSTRLQKAGFFIYSIKQNDMDNNEISKELQLQIDEILLKVDELNNTEAVLYCSNEIIKKLEKNHVYTNDYSFFIPAY